MAAGWRRTVGLLADGTVLAAGRNSEGQCGVQSWREMVALSCGDWHSVGVRADGSALAAGNNRRGQCSVDDWRDLIAVAAGYMHTVALRRDGRVLAAGDRTTGAGAMRGKRVALARAATTPSRSRVRGVRRRQQPGLCDVGDWQEIVGCGGTRRHRAPTARSSARGATPAVSATSAPGRESGLREPEPEQRARKPGRAGANVAGSSGFAPAHGLLLGHRKREPACTFSSAASASMRAYLQAGSVSACPGQALPEVTSAAMPCRVAMRSRRRRSGSQGGSEPAAPGGSGRRRR